VTNRFDSSSVGADVSTLWTRTCGKRVVRESADGGTGASHPRDHVAEQCLAVAENPSLATRWGSKRTVRVVCPMSRGSLPAAPFQRNKPLARVRCSKGSAEAAVEHPRNAGNRTGRHSGPCWGGVDIESRPSTPLFTLDREPPRAKRSSRGHIRTPHPATFLRATPDLAPRSCGSPDLAARPPATNHLRPLGVMLSVCGRQLPPDDGIERTANANTEGEIR